MRAGQTDEDETHQATPMIAAQCRILSLVEAAEDCGRTGSVMAKKKWIQRRVARKELVETVFSRSSRGIAELDLLKFQAEHRAIERVTKRNKRA